jgi:hypothetical protein
MLTPLSYFRPVIIHRLKQAVLAIMLVAVAVATKKKPKGGSTKRKSHPDEEEVSKPRSPNFAPWEDLLLCKAWVSVSMDPSVGCNQKRATFWKRVEEKFNLLYDAYDMEEDDGVKALGGRVAGQLDNRFSKVIKVDIVVFNKYFLQIHTERPSGVPWILHRGLSCERYLEIEGKPYKFEHCVETLHKVPKYNPLLVNVESPSSDDEAPPDRNRMNGVMGGTLERPQGRKAAKAEASNKRRSKRADEEVETEAAAASRIADSFQSLTYSMVSGQEFDRMERAIKLLREQGRHALAEKKMDELLSRLENDQVDKTTAVTEVSVVAPPPPPPKALTPPPALPPSPPSSPDEGAHYSHTTGEDGVSALQPDFSPTRLTRSSLPPPTRLPSSLVVFVPPAPPPATMGGAAVQLTPAAASGAPIGVTPTPPAPDHVVATSRRLAARRERTRLTIAAMLHAEATRGPSPTPALPEEDEDDSSTTVVGESRKVVVSENSQWGTIDTNPIVWGTSSSSKEYKK